MRPASHGILLTRVMLLFILQLCGAGESTANLPLSNRSIKFDQYTVDNGLSQNSVSCILQDGKGFMWFGTADGLNKFDGYSFTSYRHSSKDTTTIPHNSIRSLFEDPAGNLWIGTDRGVCRYNRATDSFIRYGSPPEYSDHFGVFALYSNQEGRLWLGAGQGLYSLLIDEQRYTKYAVPDSSSFPNQSVVSRLTGGIGGTIWVGTRSGLLRFDVGSEKFLPLPLPRSEAKSLARINVQNIVAQSDSVLWVCTVGSGLFRLNLKDHSLSTHRDFFGTSTLASSSAVHALAVDAKGTLWISILNSGLFLLDMKSSQLTTFKNDDQSGPGLGTKLVSAIYRDRTGVMWVGTDGAGIKKENRQRKQFDHVRHIPGSVDGPAGNFVKAIFEDRERNLWVGTYGDGLSKRDFATGRWRFFRRTQDNRSGLPSNIILSIAEDAKGTMWIGTDSGLTKYTPGAGFNTYRLADKITSAPEFLTITSILPEPNGRLLVGTMSGLLVFDPATERFSSLDSNRDDGPTSGAAHTIYKDRRGNLWVGMYASGLFKFESHAKTWTHFAHDVKDTSSLPNKTVRTICEDQDGVLWIGTEEGLSRLNPKSSRFSTFKREDGLPNEFIYGLLCDNRGNLWISTNKGLSKFDPQQKTFRNYDVGDGLQSYEFNTGAFFKSRDGKMFFGGVNGITEFFPDSIRDNPGLSSVVLTGFKLFDQPYSRWGDLSEISEIVLDHDENIFSFQFAGLEFSNQQRNTYAYLMADLEKDWTYCGARREVRYTNLSPGVYHFRVRSANSDGVWSKEVLLVTIDIRPPLWKTWWFRLIAITFVVAFVGGSTRYIEMRAIRKRIDVLERAEALNRERERISKDMHDDIGANLTKIAIFSELALKDTHDSESITSQIQKVLVTARETIDNMSSLVWAINPRNDKLDNLVGYIREFTSAFLDGTTIACRFDIPEGVLEIPLTAEARRNVFLVIKEALNNIVKHSSASEVRLALDGSDSGFVFTIADNGCGFESAQPSFTSNGLINMSKRIEDIGGDFHLSSSPGMGTTIQLCIPLSDASPNSRLSQ